MLGGEGLAGEVRAIGNMAARLAEAGKMGFHRCLAPRSSLKRLERSVAIEIIGVGNVSEAMEALF